MAKFKNSEFVIESLSIEAINLNFLPEAFERNDAIPAELIEANYNIFNSEDGKFFKIILFCESTHRLPNGYSFACVAEGGFTFSSELTLDDKNQFLFESGIPFVIAHMRSFLQSISSASSGPPFILPSIELGNFIRSVALEKEQEEKASIKAGKTEKKSVTTSKVKTSAKK